MKNKKEPKKYQTENGIVTQRDGYLQYNNSSVSYMLEIKRSDIQRLSRVQYDLNPDRAWAYIDGYKIIPNGQDNLQPQRIWDLMQTNGMISALMQVQTELTWGYGPALYKEVKTGGEINREWVDAPEIEQYLESLDYKKYLLNSLSEYAGSQRVYSFVQKNLGSLIGRKSTIAGMRSICDKDCRFEYPELYLADPKNIIVGNYVQPWLEGLTAYPVWDYKNAYKNNVSIHYSDFKPYGTNYTFRPAFMAAESWHRLGSDSPLILDYYLNNMMVPDFHIETPWDFWEQEVKKLKTECLDKGIPYTVELYKKREKEIFDQVAGTLVGKTNMGKFAHTKYGYDEKGNHIGWKITPVNKNVNEIIEGILEINKAAMIASTNVFGVQPSLSSISTEHSLGSGSQILYALATHYASKIAIPEMVVTDLPNKLISLMFGPGSPKLGFYHQTVKAQSQTSPGDRMAQNA